MTYRSWRIGTTMKTYAPSSEDRIAAWHVIDAADRPIGRVATEVASLLRGKHKPTFSPATNQGDYVIVVNAAQVAATGKKLEQKKYYRHSGYPGALKERTLKEMMERFPERVIEQAVRGMLPRNRLGREQFRQLRVYAGAEHPHEGQIIESVKREASS
jgi:large subunit ribosomal protein L13